MIKSGKRETKERVELPHQENIRAICDNENNKHSGILEADTIKQCYGHREEQTGLSKLGLVARPMLEGKLNLKQLFSA